MGKTIYPLNSAGDTVVYIIISAFCTHPPEAYHRYVSGCQQTIHFPVVKVLLVDFFVERGVCIWNSLPSTFLRVFNIVCFMFLC